MYQLSVLNRTQDTLEVALLSAPHEPFLIPPSSTETFYSSSWGTLGSLSLATTLPSPPKEKRFRTIRSTSISLKRHYSNATSGWELLGSDETHLPWKSYRLKLSRNHHQLIVFPNRSLSSFLADLPSSLPLSSLTLPGTHNSVAFYGWPISQCQSPSTTLATQFSSGIRVLDIRLSVINGVLISYHGIYPQKLPFLDIVQAVHTFLTSADGEKETMVMSVKQEDKASFLFSQLVHAAVYKGPGGKDMWFLENRIPNLGDVRGKVVLLSRFGGDGKGWEGGLEGLGIHPTIWPDSKPEGFEWWLKSTKVKTHDWYSIPSFLALPEKAVRSSRILLQPTPLPLYPVLPITYLSASSFPLAPPPLVACGFGWPSWGLGVEGVNSRVGKWILKCLSGNNGTEKDAPHYTKASQSGSTVSGPMQAGESRLRGWCLMDYYREPVDVGLVRLLVECNYRGRKSGEEGWP